jgi:hypothetical protein
LRPDLATRPKKLDRLLKFGQGRFDSCSGSDKAAPSHQTCRLITKRKTRRREPAGLHSKIAVKSAPFPARKSAVQLAFPSGLQAVAELPLVVLSQDPSRKRSCRSRIQERHDAGEICRCRFGETWPTGRRRSCETRSRPFGRPFRTDLRAGTKANCDLLIVCPCKTAGSCGTKFGRDQRFPHLCGSRRHRM